jgi:hypothetical protein
MSIKNIRSWIVTLTLAAGLIPFSGALGAQSQNQYPNERQQPPSAQQQPPAEQEPPNAQQPNQKTPHTYLGKIVKTKDGKYALLTDAQKGQGYYLDDQKDASKFEQKDVKVVATLDPQTSTLHVIQIKLAS